MNVRPLSPITFHILLAIATEPAHGALISSRVAYDTFGELELTLVSIRDNLERLVRRGWVVCEPHTQTRPGSTRRYALTDQGRVVLENDLYRWRIVTARAADVLKRA